jgi:MFS family permease
VIGYYIALYTVASFATNGLNLSFTQGAAIQSILAAAQIFGRPGWGQLLDIGGRVNMAIVCYIVAGLSCLVIWLPAKSFGVLVFFALVQGLTGGTIWSAAAPITARVVGIQDLASALSIFWLACVIPCLVGEPIAIALASYSQSTLGRTGPAVYYISIGFAGGMYLAGVGFLYGSKVWLQKSAKPWIKT